MEKLGFSSWKISSHHLSTTRDDISNLLILLLNSLIRDRLYLENAERYS